MEVKEIKESEFQMFTKGKGKVLVDCYATWCGPCRMMAPIIDSLAKETEDCKFYKLDVDQAEEIAMEYGINSIPTLLLFENGELVKRSVGLLSKDDLENFINQN